VGSALYTKTKYTKPTSSQRPGVRGTSALLLLTALFWLLGTAVAGSAVAQDGGEQKRSRSWARKHEIDKLTGKRLTKANEFLANEQLDEVDAMLDKLRIRSLNANEKTKLYTLRAFVSLARQDFTAAKEFFELTIAEKFLDAEKSADLRFKIALICMQQEKWAEAVENLNRWFKLEKDPNSSAYYLLALAYWQSDDIDSSLTPAMKAVALTEKPQESWLKLLLAIRLTRKEYEETIPLLDQMIRRYPRKTYWLQLSTLHGALGNYEESLIPLQLAYTQGMLTEDSEIRRLAELLLYLELPYRAADVMRSGLESNVVDEDSEYYELLSNSWIMAREYDRAVTPLVRAAELAEGGRIYQRLAEVHIQQERWPEAAEALGLALEKGDLPNPGQATLLMGIVLYSQERPETALGWFDKAKAFPESEQEAGAWVKHIQREIDAGQELSS
jgi:Tfp pilus assembly protein PilF